MNRQKSKEYYRAVISFSSCIYSFVAIVITDCHLIYHIVASTSPSHFEAYAGLFRLLMKMTFDPYLPFDKKLLS